MLKSREEVDTGRLAQLEMNLRTAHSEMASHIVMAYCVVVTVNEANEVAAFRLNVDNEPPFAKIVGDKRSRIETTAINAEALLPDGPFNLWQGGETTAHMIHVALSGLRGRTLPWVTVEAALDHAFRLGLLERTVDSKDWPTDLGGAGGVKVRVSKGDTAGGKGGGAYGAKVAEAELGTSEIQDLAEQVAEMKKAAAGQKLRFKVTVEVGEGGSTPQGVLDAVNALLAKVKKGWKLGA